MEYDIKLRTSIYQEPVNDTYIHDMVGEMIKKQKKT